MSIINTDFESLARRLTGSFHKELETKLKAELMKSADKIVTKLAFDMTRELYGNILAYSDLEKDQVSVTLQIDGVKELVK